MQMWERQKKIWAAFVGFMAFMLLCTLISRAVYASKLPQVTVSLSRRMTINHDVEAEGIVRQGREYAVNAVSGLRVRTVYAHVGDQVTKETLLFDLDMEDLKDQISQKELAIQKLKLQIQDLEQERSEAEQKLEQDSERANEDYSRTDSRTMEELQKAEEELDDAEDAYESHKDDEALVTSEEDRKAQEKAYEKWEKREVKLKEARERAEAAYEAAKEEEARLREELQKKEEQPQENPDDGKLQELREALEAAQAALDDAKAAYEEADEAYQSHVAEPVEKPDFAAEDEARENWESEKASLKAAVEAAEEALDKAGKARDDALLEAGRKVDDAAQPASFGHSLEIDRLELKSLQKELERYQEVLERQGQVYPEAEGIITQIQVSPGERVPDGAAVVYADLESPMQFFVSLTKEQKKYVNQGDSVSLSLGGGKEQEAKVDYVAENDADPEHFDALVFLPEGLGTIGESGIFKVEAQSETYPCCIPIDALHEDSNHRNFVYIVSSRPGILGEELAAELVYVKVLDKNDSYAAIEEGVIGGETELIVGTTEELEDRKVVRYKE